MLLSFSFSLQAQGEYVFSVSNQNYNNLTNPISLNNGELWDDPEFVIPLGFDFQVGPHLFNTIFIPEWSVGGVLSSSTNDFGILPILLPIAQDIIDLGYTIGTSQSPISYKTEGAPGNQIIKIEWNNVGFFEDGTGSDFMNFQLWLYETTNVIEYRYGPSQINNPNGSFEGETGPIVGLLPSIDLEEDSLQQEGYLLSGDPANTTNNVLPPGVLLENPLSVQGAIPNGTVYTFTPQNLSINDFENNDFSIYPNPTKDFFQINTKAEDYNVIIYNNLGQIMRCSNPSQGIYDISNLPFGLYFIQIESLTGKKTKKLIKR